MFPVEQAEGDDEIYLVFIMDIREKKQAEELAQQNELRERQRLTHRALPHHHRTDGHPRLRVAH
ncbi:MAG: hypothetical protein V8Q84_05285 [Bilophila sp.]